MTTYNNIMNEISANAKRNMALYNRASVVLKETEIVLNNLNENLYVFAMSGMIGGQQKFRTEENTLYYIMRLFLDKKQFGSFMGLKAFYADHIANDSIEATWKNFKGEEVCDDLYVGREDFYKYASTEEKVVALYELHRTIEKVENRKDYHSLQGKEEVVVKIYNAAIKELRKLEQELIDHLSKTYKTLEDVDRHYTMKSYGNGWYESYRGGINNCYTQF